MTNHVCSPSSGSYANIKSPIVVVIYLRGNPTSKDELLQMPPFINYSKDCGITLS